MCGIWALFGHTTDSPLADCDCSFGRLRHRGPDAWRIQYDRRIKNGCLGFTRLTIVDSVYGMQPMTLHKYPNLLLVCNGEIYNYKKLGETLGFDYETHCDVESVLQLYAHNGGDVDACLRMLDGVYAFCLVDLGRRKVLLGRDPLGVRPLFTLRVRSAFLGVASEAKGLMSLAVEDDKRELGQFPAGHWAVYDLLDDGTVRLVQQRRYYSVGTAVGFTPGGPFHDRSRDDVHRNVRTLLARAVVKRLMSDRRIGCLLSGGLDSSLVAALLAKYAPIHKLPYRIQCFTIGMKESTDLMAARKVVQHIGAVEHHEIIFTREDVAEVLDEVIYHLETVDITTIRASIGMYLVSRYVQLKTDTTVLMSGEGADELCQGYIYFREAPHPLAGHLESVRLLEDIHLYDGLRADRATAAHGLEVRLPFLDLAFLDYYLGLEPEARCPVGGVEKYLLRRAFHGTGLIPESILWRRKEAFSDGVTSVNESLFGVIADIVESKITDGQLAEADVKYPHLTPKTKEAYYYREIFEKHFSGQAKSFTPYFWMPKWCNADDPSARFLPHYNSDENHTLPSRPVPPPS